MGFYERNILPRVVDFACGTRVVQRQREKVVPHAKGRVLEVGMGSGHNLPFYDSTQVDTVIGLEPAEEMRAFAKRRAVGMAINIEWLELEGENIPLDNASVDTVVVTYTLCTIPDVELALRGMHRVLKPGGRLLFCEHGKAPTESVLRWQGRLNPIWGRLFGGCRLDRDIPNLVGEAGFKIESLKSMYLPKTPKFAGFNYWGSAVPD
jgi:ubiquinone/menaquinone biosynthesis C-methylase UbiE